MKALQIAGFSCFVGTIEVYLVGRSTRARTQEHGLRVYARSGRIGAVEELREFVILLALMAVIDAVAIEVALRVMPA